MVMASVWRFLPSLLPLHSARLERWRLLVVGSGWVAVPWELSALAYWTLFHRLILPKGAVPPLATLLLLSPAELVRVPSASEPRRHSSYFLDHLGARINWGSRSAPL